MTSIHVLEMEGVISSEPLAAISSANLCPASAACFFCDDNAEIIIDRLGHTNTAVNDLRGNIILTTNALGGTTLMGYDGNNNKTTEIAFLNGAPYANELNTPTIAPGMPTIL